MRSKDHRRRQEAKRRTISDRLRGFIYQVRQLFTTRPEELLKRVEDIQMRKPTVHNKEPKHLDVRE